MEQPQVPEGGVVRDDGCVCPPPPPKEPCQKDLSTCPYDPRFPNQNQTRRCYLSFIDFQRCARLLGDYPGCNYFLKCYLALCPLEWTERWFSQMEKGTFPRKIYPPKPIIRPEEGQDQCAIEQDGPPPENIC